MNTNLEGITHPSQLFEPESLTSQAKRVASLAIENTRKAFEELEQAEQKCSSYIYSLAQWTQENCPAKRQPHFLFEGMCAYAERQFKERFNVVNLKEALPVWAVYKSNILAGMRLGLKPTEFSTEWEFRKATAERRHLAPVTGSQSDEVTKGSVTQLPAARPIRFEQAEKFVLGMMVQAPMQTLLTRLLVEAEYVKRGKEDEAQKIIEDAVSRLSALVDKRRIKNEATKAALTT